MARAERRGPSAEGGGQKAEGRKSPGGGMGKQNVEIVAHYTSWHIDRTSELAWDHSRGRLGHTLHDTGHLPRKGAADRVPAPIVREQVKPVWPDGRINNLPG